MENTEKKVMGAEYTELNQNTEDQTGETPVKATVVPTDSAERKSFTLLGVTVSWKPWSKKKKIAAGAAVVGGLGYAGYKLVKSKLTGVGIEDAVIDLPETPELPTGKEPWEDMANVFYTGADGELRSMDTDDVVPNDVLENMKTFE